MGRTVQSVPEFYTDSIEDLGAVREVSWHARFVFEGEDPAGEWHYYGTTPGPEHPSAVQHPVTHFPAAFDLLDAADSHLLYDLALIAEKQALAA